MSTHNEFLIDLHPLLQEIELSISHVQKAEKECDEARSRYRELDKDLDQARADLIRYHDLLNLCLEKGIDPTQAKLLSSLNTGTSKPNHASNRSQFSAAATHMAMASDSQPVKQGIWARLLRFIKSK